MNLSQYTDLHIGAANSLAEDVRRASETFGQNDPLVAMYLRLFIYHKDRAQVSATLNALSLDDEKLMGIKRPEEKKK